jgi:hypothetical protein
MAGKIVILLEKQPRDRSNHFDAAGHNLAEVFDIRVWFDEFMLSVTVCHFIHIL